MPLVLSPVIGTASAPKRDFVESLGMRFVDREEEDFVDVCKSMTEGKGVHHAIDPVGGKHLLRSYKSLGREVNCTTSGRRCGEGQQKIEDF
ncbi:MAG: hypothetical protein Ct9H90mP24_4230 [Methanobacteriota archaeon]|nr:MAG: hypothetical protein Ct9H90mP24_4230 [Euryarchaeota archaeon]